MAVVRDVINIMKELAPEDAAGSWDNVGLLVGDENAVVENVIIKPIGQITAGGFFGRRLMELIKNGIAVYSAHTNLDVAENGTNDTLFEALRLKDKTALVVENEPIGRVGYTDKKYSLEAFAGYAAKILDSRGVCFVGDKNHIIGKIGICAGSAAGEKYLCAAKASGCDVYLTGDVSYSNARAAADMGLNLIIAPHFASEVLVITY